MVKVVIFIFFVATQVSCISQHSADKINEVGGPCKDCIAALDYKLLNLNLKSSDTIIGYATSNPKLKITGTVFKSDGKTPASNTILYIYQIDRNGLYTPSNEPIGFEKRH